MLPPPQHSPRIAGIEETLPIAVLYNKVVGPMEVRRNW
jgi:hypothetical protein